MEKQQMTDADKIKYLEGWVERLVGEKQTLNYLLEVKESDRQHYIENYEGAIGRNQEQRLKIQQLETELAAAKASNPTTRAVHDVAELYKDQPTAETNP
jgi:phage shock protein A